VSFIASNPLLSKKWPTPRCQVDDEDDEDEEVDDEVENVEEEVSEK